MGYKQGLFEFFEKVGHCISSIMKVSLPCFYTILIFGKIFIIENAAGFFNQPYLPNKSMK